MYRKRLFTATEIKIKAFPVIACIVISGCQRGLVKPSASEAKSYAEDRALIEDLQSHYMFVLDFGDIDHSYDLVVQSLTKDKFKKLKSL